MTAKLSTGVVLVLAALVALVAATDRTPSTEVAAGPLVASVYPADEPAGLLVTSGGWAYCEQMRPVAQRTHHTLLCGRYAKDAYVGAGLRPLRHLDWGNAAYLERLAAAAAALHRRVGGELVLIGVSYSGFGVATLATHHPELQPDRLIVIDSYFDLVARRRLLPDSHETAREIDKEAGAAPAELRRRSATAAGLARLVRSGTRLTVVWSVSEQERRRFNGATCGRDASAATLAQLAGRLHRPVVGWVTRNGHGRDLWRHGAGIVRGTIPGTRITFPASGAVPAGSFCGS